ncbi:oligouridylate-binding protein 1 [Phtheirospermum japonicum]|uniref:Oligouridylate-binding protein 1 n=1 Tax=Phtheirospermum japonicum TaxID=374723 RepID=A0A830BNU8_9LAMI|nr:oligouridylate-binding protein 1 [Phtheirospermum japonicum]
MKPEAHLRVLGGQFLNRLGSSRVRRNEDRQVTYYGKRSNDVVEATDHPSRHSSRRVPAFIINVVLDAAIKIARKWLGSRQIRCNWASKGAGLGDDQQSSDSKNVVELTNGTSEDGEEKRNEDAPENNPQCTTVYVGNLAPEVTSVDLHRHFHALGAGVIEDVRIQRGKGFGFIRYSSHAEAARAIQVGNARFLFGKPVKCSWGSKPTPPGTSSTPLPPPAAAHVAGFTAADLAAYGRQLALSKMSAAQAQALMNPQAQRLAAAGQPIYTGAGYSSIAAPQPPLYYQ